MLIEKEGDCDEGIKLKKAWIQSEALALFQIGQKKGNFLVPIAWCESTLWGKQVLFLAVKA